MYVTAKAYFQKTLAIEAELVESRFELGALYEAEKKFDRAASIYRDILDKNPHNVQASMALGHVYHRKGTGREKLLHFLPT